MPKREHARQRRTIDPAFQRANGLNTFKVAHVASPTTTSRVNTIAAYGNIMLMGQYMDNFMTSNALQPVSIKGTAFAQV